MDIYLYKNIFENTQTCDFFIFKINITPLAVDIFLLDKYKIMSINVRSKINVKYTSIHRQEGTVLSSVGSTYGFGFRKHQV